MQAKSRSKNCCRDGYISNKNRSPEKSGLPNWLRHVISCAAIPPLRSKPAVLSVITGGGK